MKLPSPAPSGHPLPQVERGIIRPLSQVAKEQQERRRNLPSPLAGEGVSRRLTGEEFAREQAKRLRHDMTEAETKLWHALRGRRFEGNKFRRQVAIGNFIVDFVCYGQRLIVELDGSQHEGSQHDKQRDAWLESQGFRVLRIWNNYVLQNMDGALAMISDALTRPSPASQERGTLSGKRRGEGVDNLPSPFTGEGAPKGREREVKNET
jgi:very-short-patch-repair endonuclease